MVLSLIVLPNLADKLFGCGPANEAIDEDQRLFFIDMLPKHLYIHRGIEILFGADERPNT